MLRRFTARQTAKKIARDAGWREPVRGARPVMMRRAVARRHWPWSNAYGGAEDLYCGRLRANPSEASVLPDFHIIIGNVYGVDKADFALFETHDQRLSANAAAKKSHAAK